MGEILELKCDCGYAETLFVGVHEDMRVPPLAMAHCAQCRRMVSLSEQPHMRCPECRGPVTVVELPMTRDDSNDGWEDSHEGDLSGGAQEAELFDPEIDFDARLPCPRCGKTTLAMRRAGVFD